MGGAWVCAAASQAASSRTHSTRPKPSTTSSELFARAQQRSARCVHRPSTVPAAPLDTAATVFHPPWWRTTEAVSSSRLAACRMKGLVRSVDIKANAQAPALRAQLEQQHTGTPHPNTEPLPSHRSLTDQYMHLYERGSVASKQRFLGDPPPPLEVVAELGVHAHCL